MKKSVFILFLFPAIAFSQRIATLDSTWRESSGGKFFEVRLTEYTTGESVLTRTFVGDTLTIFQNYLNRFISEGNQMAGEARSASRFSKNITQVIQANSEALAATGRDVLDTLTSRDAIPLLAGGWTVKDTAGSIDISFNVNNSGQLRYTITGFQARNAFLFGATMRLNNYKSTGQDVDFFRGAGGNWFTIDDKTRLRHPGNPDAVNRGSLKGASAETIELKPVSTKNTKKKPAKKKN